MHNYEVPGQFYLGKLYDLDTQKRDDAPLLYDAKDLTTHAVCVGMTGSGKTGLCISLLEEAAIDGVPAIIIDPKGDMGNLLLAFPDLSPQDFLPWLDPAEATRQNVSLEELAEATAKRWREGLAAWDQPPERIARYRQSVDTAIYTPGSSAGLPLSVLRSFSSPAKQTLEDADALRDRIAAAVSGLLGLLGIQADPLRSREHVLIATLLDKAWREGRDLQIEDLIRQVQSPPMDKVGFIDLESFYPAKDRFELAMQLNNLLAAPGFSAWMQGEPLDVQRLLFTPEGKPRHSIISIAHLSDAERMFVVTLLLNEVLAWMRRQSGTSSLRALLYMDEVFGYFPPTANPPSKMPMLTLLKQARAFGLGVVLATQNPVDLDYKGLSNAGTWFLGRLQTERDKARVLEGLEGASAAAGTAMDRQKLEAILSALGQRVFLMNNVHEDAPVVFQTRWALSFLRGPLTREQIKTLMEDRVAGDSVQPAAAPSATPRPAISAAAAGQRPVLPPGVPERFVAAGPGTAEAMVYRPSLLAVARLHFVQATAKVDTWEELVIRLPVGEQLDSDVWSSAQMEPGELPEFAASPEPDAQYEPLPSELSQPKTYTRLAAELKDHLYRNRRFTVWRCPALKMLSEPGETEGDFRARLTLAAHEERDRQVEMLRTKYRPKLASLEDQVRRAEQRLEREQSQSSHQVLQTAISLGASVLGALLGRKTFSSTTMTRAASTARAASRATRERTDVAHAAEALQALRQKQADLEAQVEADIAEVRDRYSPQRLEITPVEIKPRKSDIDVTELWLAWEPEAKRH